MCVQLRAATLGGSRYEKCRLSFSFPFQGHLQPGGGGATVEAIIGPDGAQAFQEVCLVRSRACMWLFYQLLSRERAIVAVCSCMSCHQWSICAHLACTLSVDSVQSWLVFNLSRL